LGSDHPYVAITLSAMAELYYDQGQYAETESLYQRMLAINEKRLVLDHPDHPGTLRPPRHKCAGVPVSHPTLPVAPLVETTGSWWG